MISIVIEENVRNNNFYNEKLSVLTFLNKEMEKLIDTRTPKSPEYFLDFVRSIPKKVIKGCRLVKNILNGNHMSEIHAWLKLFRTLYKIRK